MGRHAAKLTAEFKSNPSLLLYRFKTVTSPKNPVDSITIAAAGLVAIVTGCSD